MMLKSVTPLLRRLVGAASQSRLLHADVVSELTAAMPGRSDALLSSDAVREQHGHDESYHTTRMPDTVAYPANVEEVSAVMKVVTKHRVPVIPFGTGTGLEGGIVPLADSALTLDLSLMNEIVGVNPEDFDVTVRAGVTRVQLNRELASSGLWFPVDPGADCSLCGMCATSASGTNAVRYGTMRENTINLEVVLPDGRIIHTAGEGKRPRKTSAGYNLTNLFVGSEGTLGVITAATLRVYGIPEHVISAVVQFDTVEAAVDAVLATLQYGVNMARIEFLDERTMDACNKYSKLSYEVKPTLFLEFHGSEATTKEQADTVQELCTEYGGGEFQRASETEARNKLWKARHDLLYATQALRPGHRCLITDVCVPISKLPEMIRHSKAGVETYGLIATVLGHVGDGNYHVFVNVDENNPAEIEASEKFKNEMARYALTLGGTCSGEHGIGMGKRGLLVEEVGQNTVDVMRGVKEAFDPLGIMNPGKIFK